MVNKAGKKAAKGLRREVMRNKQVKCPHRLPRQCMGFTAHLCRHTTLLAGIRAGRCDLHRLPGHLFQGGQWLVR